MDKTETNAETNAEESNSRRSEHRGGFGEFGGEGSRNFIDRTFIERILLVGVATSKKAFNPAITSLKELAQLVRTAGGNPVEKLLVKREAPHPGTYIGKGKVEELHQICEQLDIDTVVFDHDLTASQQVNLEKVIGRSAIDRTTVILDIFAQNAASLEGKVQVELAQLKHRSVKLRRSGSTYSQQAGGIGSRGPGETKLETDRRSIFRKTRQLEKELEAISKRRKNQSKRRDVTSIPTISLVGYTNAGKSSLLNALTGASVISRNKLFSTLEATTRKLDLSGGQQCLLTDTVGFISKLPHTLIEAFASTLSGITDADLLIHIIDVTADDIEAQMAEVNSVLEMIGGHEIPQVLVFNKIDLLGEESIDILKMQYQSGFFISVETRKGLEELLAAIPKYLSEGAIVGSLLVPFAEGDVMADIHRSTHITSQKQTDEGMFYEVEMSAKEAARFWKYKVVNG